MRSTSRQQRRDKNDRAVETRHWYTSTSQVYKAVEMQVSTLGCLHKNLSMFLYIWSLVTCQTIPKRTMDSNFLFLATLEHIFSKRVLSARFSLLSIPLQSEFSTVPHALWYPQVAIQLTSVQGTVVLPVCLANLIL